jgi:hypothetical protein
MRRFLVIVAERIQITCVCSQTGATENITKPDAFTASTGVKWSLGFSPGVVVVHTDKGPIFTAEKKDRGQGLEEQSENGNRCEFRNLI